MFTNDLNKNSISLIEDICKKQISNKSGKLIPLVDVDNKQMELVIYNGFKNIFPNSEYYGDKTHSFDFITNSDGVNVKVLSEKNKKIKLHQMKSKVDTFAKIKSTKKLIYAVIDTYNQRLKDEKKKFHIKKHFDFILRRNAKGEQYSKYIDCYIFEATEIEKDKISNIQTKKGYIFFTYNNIKYQYSIGDCTLSVVFDTKICQFFCSMNAAEHKILEINKLKAFKQQTK